jgi:hypothetical protein
VTGSFAVAVGPIDPGPVFVDALVQPPEAPAPAGTETGPAGVLAVTLPPPPPLDLADRGYFAEDLLRLELLLVEPRDGTVRARKTVTREVDVRDSKAVRDLVTSALDDPSGWAPPAPPAVAAG